MFLIDGYNVLFATGAVRDIPAARSDLLARIETYCAATGQRARVYFDGRDGPFRGRSEHVDVVFLSADTTADEAIEQLVAGTSDRTAFHVVSSDRAVVEAARQHKMAATSSEEFLRALTPSPSDSEPAAKREGISDAEAKVWLRRFGLERDKP
ncbi:MAG: NYN domain-containing protein [Planctomycetes bacterium]|nr:NYN domain-containing protein [Planctomycetota bacterium]